jgi:alpha-tubulin suppressor-like RCC1 family protein
MRVRIGPLLIVGGAVLAVAPASGYASSGTAVVAWGSNGHGELGAGYRTEGFERRPVSVVGLTNVEAVVAAGQTSYALLGNGTVRAWGSNLKKELGDGAKGAGSFSTTPVVVRELTREGQTRELSGVSEIAASYGDDTHALALLSDAEHEGEVMTWGASEYGQRGNGESGFEPKGMVSPAPRYVAVAVPGLQHIVGIAAGENTDYAVREEGGKTTVWAWGENRSRLGNGEAMGPQRCPGEAGPEPCATTPQEVKFPKLPEGVRVVSVAAGKQAAYALLSNGTVLAWGMNGHGQLGDGTSIESDLPQYVCAVAAKAPCGPGSYLHGITAVSGGALFALALTEHGEVLGWGSNGYAELGGSSSSECGRTSKNCQPVPKPVQGLEGVTQIAAGGDFSLALSRGTIYAWGDAEGGHLGNSTLTDPEVCLQQTLCARTPRPVEGLPPVAGISAAASEPGEGHGVAILQSGSGPAPLFSLIPEKDALELIWTVPGEEFRIGWRVKKSEIGFRNGVVVTQACSAATPCSFQISGLTPEPYEVMVRPEHLENGRRKLKASRVGSDTPEG